MEHAQSAVPPGTGRRVRPRMPVCPSGRMRPLRRALRCLRSVQALFTLLLTLAVPGFLRAAEFYLPRSGPALLRFVRVPDRSKPFAWPFPLSGPVAATNSNSVDHIAGAAQPTEEAGPVLGPFLPAITNGIAGAAPGDLADPFMLPPGVVDNTLSASEMLVVTPQMLTDYLKPARGIL